MSFLEHKILPSVILTLLSVSKIPPLEVVILPLVPNNTSKVMLTQPLELPIMFGELPTMSIVDTIKSSELQTESQALTIKSKVLKMPLQELQMLLQVLLTQLGVTLTTSGVQQIQSLVQQIISMV